MLQQKIELGICTKGVDETVHRLFDEPATPGRPRLSGRRLKFEQDQRDSRCLCTNIGDLSVHGLWTLGARPEPVWLRRKRTLFAQAHQGLSSPLQVLEALTRRCCSAASGGDWRLMACSSCSLNSSLTRVAAQSQ